jgi:MATE family multidrug resistance protein
MMDVSGAGNHQLELLENKGWKADLKATLRLALPVVVGEIGWMAMGVADTILVSHLGPAAIGAAGIGGSVYFTFAVFGMGLFLGLDTLVSQAHGAGNREETRQWLRTGLVLAMVITLPLMLFFAGLLQTVDYWGLTPEVHRLVGPYMEAVLWGTGPLLIYAACRRYLQSVGLVRPVMLVLLSANVINVAGNWVLVDGRLGMPALGVTGSAWATVISRFYMAGMMLLIVRMTSPDVFNGRWWKSVCRVDVKTLFKLGFPASAQITLEVGIFSLAAMLVGRLAPISLAAHQIVLNITSLTFMVPLGIASAAAVRVGHGVGAKNENAARQAGWTAIALTIVMMIMIALFFLLIPVSLLRLFTRDGAIIEHGVALLAIAAVFQIFDGLQAVCTGALRGLGDTATPAAANLFAHWFIGLPVGVYLAFWRDMDVRGIWIGISTGLIVVGAVLLLAWKRKINRPIID